MSLLQTKPQLSLKRDHFTYNFESEPTSLQLATAQNWSSLKCLFPSKDSLSSSPSYSGSHNLAPNRSTYPSSFGLTHPKDDSGTLLLHHRFAWGNCPRSSRPESARPRPRSSGANAPRRSHSRRTRFPQLHLISTAGNPQGERFPKGNFGFRPKSASPFKPRTVGSQRVGGRSRLPLVLISTDSRSN